MTYSRGQITALLILRIAIGWHFLFEGLTKLMNSSWSSAGYLLDSKGWFAELFYWMASNDVVLKVVDLMNIWGLILIGFALVTGLFSRLASIAGMVLLAFYYISHPPLLGLDYIIPNEGNYFIVNKNLIELIGLWIIYLFPTSKNYGLDRFIFKSSHS